MHSGRFFVSTERGEEECIARGVLKIKSDGIVTGDNVEVEDGVITCVYPRTSYFIRPSMANVDCVNIVVSCPPQPDYFVIDKLIVSCCMAGAKFIITVNKSDISDDVYKEIVAGYSHIADKIFFTSTKTGEGLQELKDYLQGKLCAFAGQSAVGKTSLVNSLFGYELLTNDVSKKTGRGRHTTTASSIFTKDGISIVDTPGFSVLKNYIKAEELSGFYPEFKDEAKECYYRGCAHISEPDCKIKLLVESGDIPTARYERYKILYKELKEGKKYEQY